MKNQVDKHLKLLGLNVRDKVTGLEGVVTSVAFDLFGCVQAAVTPKADKDKLKDCHWFDTPRLQILDDIPVVTLPNFEKGYVAEGLKGAADKPSF